MCQTAKRTENKALEERCKRTKAETRQSDEGRQHISCQSKSVIQAIALLTSEADRESALKKLAAKLRATEARQKAVSAQQPTALYRSTHHHGFP
jgi:hypothetical protein